MGQQHAIHKFVLGTKDFDDKQSEFMYDRGWYSITDIVGEERNIIYKSRNAQEAYLKWNIYIGRKKERLTPEERKKQREERYDVLLNRIRELGLKEEDYSWYLDLRKYGGTRHAGYGLGFERLIMYITGVGNIRDVLPFPRTTGSAEF